MKKRIAMVAVVVAVVAGFAAAGFAISPTAVQKTIGWGCSPDRLPQRISGYDRTTFTATMLEDLPTRSSPPQGRAAVVVDWPGWGFCPSYDRVETDLPMTIWLRVSANEFVMYARSGGP